MALKAVLALVVMCIAGTVALQCDGCRSQYVRIKRGKYYPGPPQRFYSRPPTGYPTKGAFSYTPPPSYMMDDEPSYPGLRPAKVSRRPSEGLGDEDISNIIKYLSKQDLDKIIEFAGEKEKTEKYRDSSPDEYSRAPSDSGKRYKTNVPEIHPDRNSGYQDRPLDTDDISNVNYVTDTPKIYTNPGSYDSFFNIPLDTEESMRNNQVSLLPQALGPNNDSSNEESLPKPVNLREDFDVSFTNNVPAVVKADDSLYKVESFGNLPLMNYHSKLDTLSSYHVPHYTVTTQVQTVKSADQSTSSYASPPTRSSSPPLLQPAPPIYAAKAQSDAHLKATKIWSHKSKGTAYTLHNDGSLSLEKPTRRYYG